MMKAFKLRDPPCPSDRLDATSQGCGGKRTGVKVNLVGMCETDLNTFAEEMRWCNFAWLGGGSTRTVAGRVCASGCGCSMLRGGPAAGAVCVAAAGAAAGFGAAAGSLQEPEWFSWLVSARGRQWRTGA